jgi:hypothetical protein
MVLGVEILFKVLKNVLLHPGFVSPPNVQSATNHRLLTFND